MYWHFYKGVTKVRSIPLIVLMAVSIPGLADDAPQVEDTAAGKAVYIQTCIACHGADGKGTIPGVKDFSAAEGPLSKSDKELVENITNGFQSPGSFMAMPPKGGNPALTEEDIAAVLAFIRAELSD